MEKEVSPRRAAVWGCNGYTGKDIEKEPSYQRSYRRDLLLSAVTVDRQGGTEQTHAVKMVGNEQMHIIRA